VRMKEAAGVLGAWVVHRVLRARSGAVPTPMAQVRGTLATRPQLIVRSMIRVARHANSSVERGRCRGRCLNSIDEALVLRGSKDWNAMSRQSRLLGGTHERASGPHGAGRVEVDDGLRPGSFEVLSNRFESEKNNAFLG